MKAVIDNDVLLKGAQYGLLPQFIAAIPGKDGSIGVLGAARYVVGNRISKHASGDNCDVALSMFYDLLDRNIELEPTLEEQYAASDLELCAQRMGVELDVGESQLCSILISRALPLLVTGDKRAICAIEALLNCNKLLTQAAGKVMSLEQVVCALLEVAHTESIREAICNTPTADRTLSICFCCASAAPACKDDIMMGIASYISDLRRKAPRALSL